MWCGGVTRCGLALLLVAAAVSGDNDGPPTKKWESLLTDKRVTDVAALNGDVFAAADGGLFVKRNNQDGKMNDFFSSKHVENVWLQPPLPSSSSDETRNEASESTTSDDQRLVFVVADGILYRNKLGENDDNKWDLVYPQGHELFNRTVHNIHGNSKRIVILLKYSGVEKRTDSSTVYTKRSDIYLVEGRDPSVNPSFIGSFPATQTFVDDNGIIYTYGDLYPAGQSVGISSDGGVNWRHNKVQEAGRDGVIFAFGEMLVVTSAVGNVMKSYDKGRTFERITKFNGLPSEEVTAVVVAGPTLFVGTAGHGIYVSTNEGKTFDFHASEGRKDFTSNTVLSLALDRETSDLYAGLDNGLVVKRRVGDSEKREKEQLTFYERLFYDAKAEF